VTQQSEPSDEPQIEIVEAGEDYVRIVASPLPPGFGITLGNSLRRALLSSLSGAAVTSVRIDDVQHEFSTIPNIKEDTIEFVLNVKELRLRALSDRPGTLVLDVSGREGPVTAADIQVPEHYEIANPDLYLAALDSTKGRLHVEFNVEIGRGYAPAGQTDGLPIGVIPVDAIFSPVRKVNYRVEQTRVGQATNYDKLTMEVWTDGTISGVGSVSQSADILMTQFKLFSGMGRPVLPVMERGLGAGITLPPEHFNMPIEDLQLFMRAYNCLRRSGLMTVGQVLEKSEEELLTLRNFGRKSYDELRARLDEMGLLPADSGEQELMEAPPLGEEEAPIVARRVVEAETVPAEPPAAAEAPAEPEPAAPAKKSARKVKAAKADPVAGDGAEEEIPDWKRKLLELTGEGDAAEGGGE
jgi:DNA-directed RNA polymerase subunit alpha